MRYLFLISTLLTLGLKAWGAGVFDISERQGAFALLSDNGQMATVCVDKGENVTVRKVAELLADDVERVTGQRPRITAKPAQGAVVIGTIGHNAYIDRLVRSGKLDVSAISNGWEQYVAKVVDGRLVIAGCDRRGAAYGALSLSEAIGVSPWYWWADIPVTRHPSLYVNADIVSEAPAVRYRGIFINDEDWGLKPWATNNYEKKLGDIGPKTYARVCELLLRLKANMLAPAMHSCTGAFYSHPESKVVCDSFGIIVTTSHCEPLLLNNAAKSEWDGQRDGEWNYKTNSQTIYKKWDDRLTEAAKYENIYTVAMRGVHDEGLRGSLPMEERVPLIERVIGDQRTLLEKHCASSSARDIPQIFVPYKETMDIYENGLRVPDDITLVWVDDNYGYMKRVASPEEQRRSGRSGVYYHLSYLGAPHDYLWLNTTPPVLMYEELKKAYDNGADRYWLLNVGDIKPMELGMQTFFDLAWNIAREDNAAFTIDDAYTHQAEFLARTFHGPTCHTAHGSIDHTTPHHSVCRGIAATYQAILDDYYRLAWSRKPEYMGWEYQWDDQAHTGLKPTEFSFRHYDEAQRRLADYQRISDEVERLSATLAPAVTVPTEDNSSPASATTLRAAFFELLQFPVQAACQMNRKFLMAQLNQELAAEGRKAEANWAARQMELAYDSINALNRRYNKQLGGKWDGMMALSTSFTKSCQYYQKPEVKRFEDAGEQPVVLTPLRDLPAEGCLVLDLKQFRHQRHTDGIRLVRGLGYDGQVLQFGDPSKPPKDGSQETVTYPFRALGDSVDIIIYSVPFWPLYKGKTNRIAVSIDNGPVQVFENKFKEYDRTWKDQVMRNAAIGRLRFAVDSHRETSLLKIQADPGQMIQRIVLDWGRLQPSYIGPMQ